MGSVYQRASDGRWVAAFSHGPRGQRRTTVRYAPSEEAADAIVLEVEGPPEWRHVDRSGDCWLWTGSRNWAGYGLAWDGERRRIAHRLIFEREVGPIPDGMHVLHHCDNPPCVRPDHLFLGTATDNMRDMVAKGRAAWQRRSSLIPGRSALLRGAAGTPLAP